MEKYPQNDQRYQPSNTSRRRVLRTTGALTAAGMFGAGLGTGIVGAQNVDDPEIRDLCEAVPVDLCMVLDVSGSMSIPANGQTRLDVAKDGAKTLVDEFDESDQGALVSFEDVARREFDLTTMDAAGKSGLEDAIDDLVPLTLTNTQGGIIFGAEELLGDDDFDVNLIGADITTPSSNARPDVTKVMILLADGESNTYYDENGNLISDLTNAHQEAVAAADAAKAAGIRILTIAIGEANEAEMAELASSEDDAFVDENLDDLVGVFQEIAEEICPTEVDIEIKPGSDPNSINPNNRGTIPVAVHSTSGFDATTIDPESLRFGSPDAVIGGDGAAVSHYSFEDVTGDGNEDDFIGHFPTQETGFTADDTEGWLIGETVDGDPIAGRDAVRIVDRGGRP